MEWFYWLQRIDWTAIGTMLTGLGTIGSAIAVTAAAIIAGRSFDDWKKQKLTERKMDHAEQILSIAHRAKDAIEDIRKPMTTQEERKAALDLMDTMDAKYRFFKESSRKNISVSYVHKIRLDKNADVRNSLDLLTSIARAYPDLNVSEPMDYLRDMFNRLESAIDHNLVQDEGDFKHRKRNPDSLWLLSMRFIDRKDDKERRKVEEAVNQIEAKCLKVLT